MQLLHKPQQPRSPRRTFEPDSPRASALLRTWSQGSSEQRRAAGESQIRTVACWRQASAVPQVSHSTERYWSQGSPERRSITSESQPWTVPCFSHAAPAPCHR